MNEKELQLFIEKLMGKVVQFYYNGEKAFHEDSHPYSFFNPQDSAFENAVIRVMSSSIITVDYENEKIFLYALDPMAFLPMTASGQHKLWEYLSEWAKTKYNVTLCIGKFDMKNPLGYYIYDHTKSYLLETMRMVNDDVMSFEDAFLED